jgi:hypothetical protein
MRTKRLIGLAMLALALTGYASASASSRSATINGRLRWGTSFRHCSPLRAGSVICVAAKGTSKALGKYEYARDAVPSGTQTTDGCPGYTTRGTVWVKGGTLTLSGAPATTCGADPRQPGVSPDANYVVTIKKGTGVLKGATGSGTILAANGTDIWNVAVTLRK